MQCRSRANRVLCCTAVLLGAVGSLAATTFAQDGELSISIKPPRFANDVAVIDINSEFELEFANNSDRPIRIATPIARAGYRGVSFEFKNENSGEAFATSQAPVDSPEDDRGASYVTIEPGETYTIKVLLTGTRWGRRWRDLPDPYADVTYTVRARYEIGSGEADNWTGKCESPQLRPRSLHLTTKRRTTFSRTVFPRWLYE